MCVKEILENQLCFRHKSHQVLYYSITNIYWHMSIFELVLMDINRHQLVSFQSIPLDWLIYKKLCCTQAMDIDFTSILMHLFAHSHFGDQIVVSIVVSLKIFKWRCLVLVQSYLLLHQVTLICWQTWLPMYTRNIDPPRIHGYAKSTWQLNVNQWRFYFLRPTNY